MISKCLKCGKKFEFTPVDGYVRRYCSVHCAHSHNHSGPKPYAKWRNGIVCNFCKEVFIPTTEHRRYCSPKCKKLARQSRVETYDVSFIKSRVKIDKKTGCWIWQLSKTGYGYGQFVIQKNGKAIQVLAHRFTYELFYGKIKPRLVVRHKPSCHNPACCNPEHLLAGTQKDNWYDSEDAHRRASAKRRGIPTAISIKVEVNGKRYASISEACRMLGLGWWTVKALAKEI